MGPSFTSFARLPPEIRLIIWQYCLPGPRIIHLQNCLVCSKVPGRKRKKRLCLPTVNLPRILFILLRLCHESRWTVLSRYEALFKPTSLRDTYYRLHYFDPLKDGIFIDDLCANTLFPWAGSTSQPSGIYNVRLLSIECNAWWNIWKKGHLRALLLGEKGLLQFKNLEELQIVFRIVTDHERQDLRVGLGYLAMMGASSRPRDIAFPRSDVDIQAEPILRSFENMSKAHPEWKVPNLKMVAWGARPATCGLHGEV